MNRISLKMAASRAWKAFLAVVVRSLRGSRIDVQQLRLSLRNSWFNSLAHVVGLSSNIVIFILLARLAGVEELGLYTFAVGLTSITVGFTGFIARVIIAREVARDSSQASYYLAHVLTFNLIVSAPLGILVSSVTGLALGLDETTQLLVLMSARNTPTNLP